MKASCLFLIICATPWDIVENTWKIIFVNLYVKFALNLSNKQIKLTNIKSGNKCSNNSKRNDFPTFEESEKKFELRSTIFYG